jgi:tRNA nucleotidyltransferase (CCA-adding enzyme)
VLPSFVVDSRLQLALPEGLRGLLEALRAEGAQPYLVGGAVRDGLLDLPIEDFDVEVHGLRPDRVRAVAARLGSVDEVGAAFSVLKVSGLVGVPGAVDVALPRRDSRVGIGHRGFAAVADPYLGVVEASRRRDFTINAMMLDTSSGEIVDPHGGRQDLAARILRAVDLDTFGDDPLRALRAVQFAARFEFGVDPATARLCAETPLGSLPPERVFGEVEKLLLKARRPSSGLRLLREWGMLPSVAPELVPLAETPQDPEWHPEGDVWLHSLQVVDEAALLVADLANDRPRALTVMLGALCHDLGKPMTTKFEDGHVRSRGHEEAGVPPTLALLERWNVHTLHGYDVRTQVLALVADHLKPGELYKERARVSDGAIRRLARRCEPDLLYRVARADCLGRRPGRFEPIAMEWFREKIRALEVELKAPDPLLRGRDLLDLGLSPGPKMGRILKEVYERQLDGAVKTLEEAREVARSIMTWA